MASDLATFANGAAGSTARATLNKVITRIQDVVNVKTWGATGDGSTNDLTAIQAAVNSVAGIKRGTIFFPPGTYVVSGPITFNIENEASIIFQGVGDLSHITGNFSGYILTRDGDDGDVDVTSGIRIIEKLRITNSHATGGGVLFDSCVGGIIRDCKIGAHIGISSTGGGPITISNVTLQGDQDAGSIGLYLNGAATVIGCDITHWEHGIRHNSIGLTAIGNRFEVNTVGIMLGQDDAGSTFQSTAVVIEGGSMEANQTAIDFHAVTGFTVSGVSGGGGVQMVRGLYMHGASYGVVIGCSFSGSVGYSSAAIAADCNGKVSFIGCTATTAASAASWSFPSDTSKIALVKCNSVATTTFANLPTATDQAEAFITDCTSATFRSVAAGGGSNRVKVRGNNASQWLVVG